MYKMDDKTKELLMRAKKSGVKDFSYSFFRKRGIKPELIGANCYGENIYYIEELDIIFKEI